MENPLISIVVPVYNVQRYVEHCLMSILGQTYKNFEVIVVDDGSTDKSYEICKDFIVQKQDARFRIYHKENQGLSHTRNFGMKHCSGESEYVVFVDSDDELTPDCLSLLISNASHDCLIIGTLLRCTKGEIINKKNDFPEEFRTEISDIWHNESFLGRLRHGLINSSCGNCYSLRVIRENRLEFKNLLPEDTFYNYEYLSIVSNVVIIEKPIYMYYIWNNTMSTVPKAEIYANYMVLQQLLYNKVCEEDSRFIDSFVYPQYRRNTQNFLKCGEYDIPRKYLKEQSIQKAMSSYEPVSFADWIVHFCMKHRFLKLAGLF